MKHPGVSWIVCRDSVSIHDAKAKSPLGATAPRLLGHCAANSGRKVKSPRELLLRARLAPDRTGADKQVVAQTPLSQLRQLPAARELADA
jgi:hypothetical protein